MTAPATLFDIPAVQQAVNYAMAKLADWQLVPQRVSRAAAEIRRVAADASARGDAGTVAQLAIVKQSLDGVQQEYLTAAPLVSSVIEAARVVQMGGTVSPGTVTDAAKLTTIMAANLGVLAQDERAIVQLGGNLSVGPGGTVVPTWLKWGLVALGVLWLVRRV
jgi:hypothetical protein